MDKKRAEWRVRLYASNFENIKGTFARIALNGNRSLDELADELERRSGLYRADTTRAIMSLMSDLVEEYLLKGYAVTGELGTLTPTVTGLWDYDRLSPSARAKNKAEIRFIPSKRMKKGLKNALLHETSRAKQGPRFNPVSRFDINDKWEYVMKPDALILIEGIHLLMNGDDPTCGFYILDSETEEVARFFPREEILLNSRSQLMVQLKGELPPGRYRFRVVSQCTTSPNPLREPLYSDSLESYRIYAPGETYTIREEGKKLY